MKKYHNFVSLFILFLSILWSFKAQLPLYRADASLPTEQFSTDRALKIVQSISEFPHYTGSENHPVVMKYLMGELQKLGFEPEIQEGFVLTERTSLTYARNLLARKKGTGTGQALLLLSHYDSNPHSALGAADAASGVATILEGLRAYLSAQPRHLNDLMVVFTDAEEPGLNGAHLFVEQHPWAKEVGLVLNFEARGSGGPGVMLLETNGGNARLIEAFDNAKPPFPVGNSLAYSIYKMLPNDTDLTVFREKGNINGFNFAFIDDHFDYHTARDNYENLNPETLKHQGTYLMSLLPYLINTDLNQLNSKKDDVYVNTPVGFFHYPFDWNIYLTSLLTFLFLVIVFLGLKTGKLQALSLLKGLWKLVLYLAVMGLSGFYGWKFILWMYPQYREILHGFTYNGYYYIAAFVALSGWISLSFYKRNENPSHWVAPYLFWLVVCWVITFKLPGAGFFGLALFFSLIGYWHVLNYHTPNLIFLALLSVPAVFMLTPMLQLLPVGLGLKMLVAAHLLFALLFILMLPYWSHLTYSGKLRTLAGLAALAFLIVAHSQSGFDEKHPKPNSLLYVLNADEEKAYWTSYDFETDNWNKNYFQNKLQTAVFDSLHVPKRLRLPSKYGSQFTLFAEAPLKTLNKAGMEVEKDTVVGNIRKLKICLTPRRKLNRINLIGNKHTQVYALKINGLDYTFFSDEKLKDLSDSVFLTYMVVENKPLELEWEIPAGQDFGFTLWEASFDLLSHPQFSIPERGPDMIPKPFVLNDAVVISQNFSF